VAINVSEIIITTAVPAPPVAKPAAPPVEAAPPAEPTSWRDFLLSVATQSWLASMVFHMALMVVLALIMGTLKMAGTIGQAPAFDPALDAQANLPEITHFEVGHTPLQPTELTTETLMLTEAPSVEAQFNDNSPVFEEAGGGLLSGETKLGGLGGFDIASSGLGPVVKGAGGVDTSAGLGANFGVGGAMTGFGSRGAGMREAMLGNGATKQSERAVAAALNWISRHQNRDGSWSLAHTRHCKGGMCSGPGDYVTDTAGTALGLLPFLAAGQTHLSTGPYQKNISGGVNWLISHQKRNGDLSMGDREQQMYAHGLAAIALCEAYGMTQDQRVGYAAQSAINFIESGQNAEGGWRYTHGTDDSDTSVFGWQVMALKSGQMARLKVNPDVLEASKRYLASCATGAYKSEFAYQPGARRSNPTLTSIGLLTSQYLGAKRGDAVIVGGVEFLMQNKPTVSERNSYYWYYATQVMHNVPGAEWDEWNRQMRRLLIETQEKSGCASGSWSPTQPEADAWGNQGGRLMVTSFCCLTLEVYYRYLPLYQLDKSGEKPDQDAPKVE
jgi:hypothetical protein